MKLKMTNCKMIHHLYLCLLFDLLCTRKIFPKIMQHTFSLAEFQGISKFTGPSPFGPYTF